jgi:hypothetical protein
LQARLESTREEPLTELPSKYKPTALPAKIRLGRKWLILVNTLAYYDTATITAVKSFIVQTPGVKVKKFFFVIDSVHK